MQAQEKLKLVSLDRDEKINIRLPKALKNALEKKAKAKGYTNLSKYVLTLLIEHGTK